MTPEQIQSRINRALIVRKEILEQIVAVPEAPKYDDVKKNDKLATVVIKDGSLKFDNFINRTLDAV
jgi:hypothetical protein